MHTHSNLKLTRCSDNRNGNDLGWREPVRKGAVEFAVCVCVQAGGRRGETLVCTPREMSPDSVLILRGGVQGGGVWSLQGNRFLQGGKSARRWVSRPGSAGSHRGMGRGSQAVGQSRSGETVRWRGGGSPHSLRPPLLPLFGQCA